MTMLPDGISLACLDVTQDAAAIHAADQCAFAESSGYAPTTLAAFCQEHLASPDLAPQLSPVVRRGEPVVGFALCRRGHDSLGLVNLLAVDQAERRRGLGTALLLTAFVAFARAGCSRVRLDVATDNSSALALYGRLGMTARHRVDVLEKPMT